ncbi:MAG: DNA translocase FtsK, partial [Exiguobacterium sp.]|nr:DNA translocase FtsK [Exiguobacterium sp.]
MAQKTRKTPVKRERPATRNTRNRKKQPIAPRTYGWVIFVLAIVAFVFALFDLGWIGKQLSDLSVYLFGGWGALTYLMMAVLLWIVLTPMKPMRRAGLFAMLASFLLFGDLLWGEARGGINGTFYNLNQYLFSDFGIVFLGIVCFLVGVSLYAPTIWGTLYHRMQESVTAVRKEWQARPKVEKQQETKRTRKTSPRPKQEETQPDTEVESDVVTMQDIPIVGFSEKVVAEKRVTDDQLRTDDSEVDATITTEEMMMTAAQDVSDTYELPPFSNLKEPVITDLSGENARLKENASKLVKTLKSFGVGVKVLKIHLGPTVTKYELQPDIGVKVGRITSLSDDLALALAAKDIRIEAPIPGKAAIGIEVPNQEVAPVCLREVLEADPVKQDDSKLLVALGRSISDETVGISLNKMPHLLVAGSTGSGKSVCINGMIVSLLMRSRPDEVRLMMIDPKMVELNVYNGVPHLLTPVVTDPKKAAQALKQVVAEMERRYELFSRYGVRNIEGY